MQNRDLQHRLVDAALPIDEANGKISQKVGEQGRLTACRAWMRILLPAFGSYSAETARSWRKLLWHADCAGWCAAVPAACWCRQYR